MVGIFSKALAVAPFLLHFAVAARKNGDALGLEVGSLPLFTFGGVKHSFEQVGIEHGEHGRDRIQAFLATDFVGRLKGFRDSAGSYFFRRLVQTNTAAFPDYASEIAGIAKGANATSDDIWMLNLMGEVLAAKVYKMAPNTSSVISKHAPASSSAGASKALLEPTRPAHQRTSGAQEDHCSTFVSLFERGDLALGHTEDWDSEFVDIIYLQDVVYPGGTHLVGFGYPGQILGFAIVANAHGLLFTQNSVWPREVHGGLGLTLVGRRAMDEATIEAAVARIRDGPQAWGVSVNIVSLAAMRGANVEVSHGGEGGPSSHGGGGGPSDVQWASGPGQSLVHFNRFRRLAGENGMDSATSRGRNDHQEVLGPPWSADELKERLCYRGEQGKQPGAVSPPLDAIYRPSTMMTWLVTKPRDGAATVLVWHGVSACEGEPRAIGLPLYTRGQGSSAYPSVFMSAFLSTFWLWW